MLLPHRFTECVGLLRILWSSFTFSHPFVCIVDIHATYTRNKIFILVYRTNSCIKLVAAFIFHLIKLTCNDFFRFLKQKMWKKKGSSAHPTSIHLLVFMPEGYKKKGEKKHFPLPSAHRLPACLRSLADIRWHLQYALYTQNKAFILICRTKSAF
jgi:hypothetical protein